jgi:hypothetical protein
MEKFMEVHGASLMENFKSGMGIHDKLGFHGFEYETHT